MPPQKHHRQYTAAPADATTVSSRCSPRRLFPSALGISLPANKQTPRLRMTSDKVKQKIVKVPGRTVEGGGRFEGSFGRYEERD